MPLLQYRDELLQRLQVRTQECAAGEKVAGELRKQLEMTKIYLEQLSSGRDSDNQEATARVLSLEAEREELQRRLDELQASLTQLTDERDRLASQYREYIQQLQGQSEQLTAQVTSLTAVSKLAELQNRRFVRSTCGFALCTCAFDVGGDGVVVRGAADRLKGCGFETD